MKKTSLNEAVAKYKDETRIALQTVYDTLNQGQRKKIVKDESVKELFDRYGVIYE
jgi:Fe2+ or Zn2+ uptake regulation protein